MSVAKIAISLDSTILHKLDELVKQHLFKNRSQAIQQALQERMNRLEHTRLARECAKIDPKIERAIADEGLAEDFTGWPDY